MLGPLSQASAQGPKRPTLGHVAFAELREADQRNAAGLLSGGDIPGR
jgi:hypothetical protein